MTKLWGGRFHKNLQNNGWMNLVLLSVLTKQLVMEDIEGSIAHVKMLGNARILPARRSGANH